ncbi:unnamed protein product [Clavelina lepadiformis]|uniref:G-protein coupled receptors family 1 profile domain-containing protein n=1 Tax=Clavelina lepadiformis TaxID=159417 RepID=A0ABP0F0N5_CLALP
MKMSGYGQIDLMEITGSQQQTTEFQTLPEVTSNLSEWINSTKHLRPVATRIPITEESMAGVLLIITSYLVLVTVWYQVKVGQKKLVLSDTLCTLTVFTLLIRISAFEFALRVRGSTNMCKIFGNWNFSGYAFNLFLPYLILWIRQRGFYNAQGQERLNTLKVKIISWITLIGIVASPVVQNAFRIVHGKMVSTPMGCRPSTDRYGRLVFNILANVGVGLSTFFQLVLLMLVLYPIIDHVSRTNLRHSSRMKKTIFRMAACTAICITSDLLFLITVHVKPAGASRFFTGLCSCYNMTINACMVVCSFADWRRRFFPMITPKRDAILSSPSPRTSANSGS